MKIPMNYLPPLPTIHPWSMEALGAPSLQSLSNVASAVYVAASRAMFFPFHLDIPVTVTGGFCINGTVVSGNVDVGVYDGEQIPIKIVSSGSVAQSGTNALQSLSMGPTVLGAGDFYLGICMDNATGTLFRGTSLSAAILRRYGAKQQVSAFPLPATSNFSNNVTNAYVPAFGIFVK